MMAAILIVTIEIVVSNDSSDWCKFSITTTAFFVSGTDNWNGVCSVAPTPRCTTQGVCPTKLREACQRSETQPVAAVLCSTESKLPCRLAHASLAGERIGEAVG